MIREAIIDLEERSIGAILIANGRLQVQDIDRVVRLQQRKGLRFGEAAKKLRLVSQADVELALALQSDHPYPQPGESGVSEQVVAAYQPFSPQVEALRGVRSQLALRWLDQAGGAKTLAILSAARKEGRSFIAANLAVVFAQIGYRTVLLDADLRNPCQHRLFGLDGRCGLTAVLLGRARLHEALRPVASLPNLSVLPAGALPPSPQDVLARPAFTQLLQELAAQADLVLLDSPPAAQATEAQIIAVRAGASLIVLRKHSSRMWRVQGVSTRVADANSTIVGAVLNEF